MNAIVISLLWLIGYLLTLSIILYMAYAIKDTKPDLANKAIKGTLVTGLFIWPIILIVALCAVFRIILIKVK